MAYVVRLLEPEIARAARGFPAVIVTGPRRAGKTTLLRHLFPKASYHLIEDPDVVARLRADPRGFLDEIRTPAILDEVQNAPELLNYLRARIDSAPQHKGRWFLTGSQEAPLMKGVTESLAGRAAVFQLLPFSTRETSKVSLFRGGFPEVVARPASAALWLRSYVQTYLERDVRAVTAVRDLATFRRFLSLLATRCGQILNRTDLAAPMGVSVPTVSSWLGVLEITGEIILVPPFFENFGKRLIKSPKVYFTDSGLACHLLGIDSVKMLESSPFLGPLFEGFIASEIVKHQLGVGRRKEIYFFRDQQGLEVDFVVPKAARELLLLEAKASHTADPAMAGSLLRLREAVKRYETRAFVVHRPARELDSLSALSSGVRAGSLERLLRTLEK
ncbi:MAG: ATP-binding protein [Planctomycetes bacterium]|nr:ATP-binding protein [Planctomycetota bacterium]